MSRSARTAAAARRARDEIVLPRPHAAAFEAFEHAAVRYCLLREPEPSDLRGDVDVLVAAPDMARAAAALEEIGFIERRAWGYEPHRFFLRIARDATVKLDLVSELRFGGADLATPALTGNLLSRATRDRGASRPAPADEFWALVLHAALDKPAIEERHRRRLQALAVEAAAADPPAPVTTSHAAAILDAVALGRWEHLTATVRSFAGAESRLHALARSAKRRIGWRMRPLGRPGVTVALLGPDGAGKTTIAERLAARFPVPVRRVYMGLYRRSRRTLPPGISLLARLLLQWSRYARAVYHRARGRVVLFDRYTDDAALPTGAGGRRDELRRRLLAGALPRPNLTLLLDAPAEELLRRKGEHDLEHLERARTHYRAIVQRTSRGHVLDATRPPEAVADEAAARIWDALVART